MPGSTLPPDIVTSFNRLTARVERLERKTSTPLSAITNSKGGALSQSNLVGVNSFQSIAPGGGNAIFLTVPGNDFFGDDGLGNNLTLKAGIFSFNLTVQPQLTAAGTSGTVTGLTVNAFTADSFVVQAATIDHRPGPFPHPSPAKQAPYANVGGTVVLPALSFCFLYTDQEEAGSLNYSCFGSIAYLGPLS